MSGIVNLTEVKDPQAREALKELNRRIAALEGTVTTTLPLTTLTSPLNCGAQRITALGVPGTGADLVDFGTLTSLLNTTIIRFLRRFQGQITHANP
jgi:hypothetical protein